VWNLSILFANPVVFGNDGRVSSSVLELAERSLGDFLAFDRRDSACVKDNQEQYQENVVRICHAHLRAKIERCSRADDGVPTLSKFEVAVGQRFGGVGHGRMDHFA
jgi:hypothetical protein